tara:strand:+ start:6086 stop:6670 length:585 start_codon:yes stop_codon:yes gene_type:complete
MSYRNFSARIEGASPLLLHNIRLSDPLDEHAKAIKVVAKKRTKTDDDLEELSRLEWLGSIYEHGGRLVMPGANLTACIRDAGKTRKLGTAVKRGLLMPGDWEIDHRYIKKSIQVMSRMSEMRERKSMKVGQARVMRTFPCVRDWSISFTGSFHPEIMNIEDIEDLLNLAGQVTGIGDLRPNYGRFSVTSFMETD